MDGVTNEDFIMLGSESDRLQEWLKKWESTISDATSEHAFLNSEVGRTAMREQEEIVAGTKRWAEAIRRRFFVSWHRGFSEDIDEGAQGKMIIDLFPHSVFRSPKEIAKHGRPDRYCPHCNACWPTTVEEYDAGTLIIHQKLERTTECHV